MYFKEVGPTEMSMYELQMLFNRDIFVGLFVFARRSDALHSMKTLSYFNLAITSF